MTHSGPQLSIQNLHSLSICLSTRLSSCLRLQAKWSVFLSTYLIQTNLIWLISCHVKTNGSFKWTQRYLACWSVPFCLIHISSVQLITGIKQTDVNHYVKTEIINSRPTGYGWVYLPHYKVADHYVTPEFKTNCGRTTNAHLHFPILDPPLLGTHTLASFFLCVSSGFICCISVHRLSQ